MDSPSAIGLTNTGVICHFNSLLQMLVSSTELADVMEKITPGTKTAEKLKTFFKEYYGGNASSIDVLRALMQDLSVRKKNVSFGNSQESATEGLVLMLEMVEGPRELKHPLRDLFEHTYIMSVRCQACNQTVSQVRDAAIQFNTFVFDALENYPKTPEEYAQSIRCNITELHDYNCEKCGTKKAKAIRIHQLVKIGRLFVVVHNKYAVAKTRYFPERFELPGRDGKPLAFKQLAQVEHSGGLNGGHYWAKVLRKEGVMCANDSCVSPDKFGPNSNVYVVLYSGVHS